MIAEQACGRVIVRVEDSLAGLAALREAVGLARLRNLELRAACIVPPTRGPAAWEHVPPIAALGASGAFEQSYLSHWRARERAAEIAVEDSFGEAMGGVPRDLVVKTVIVGGREPGALVQIASRTSDWLVVPMPQRRWWRPGRDPVRYVVTHADCPVVVVPPPKAASDLEFGGRPWRRFRRRRELSSLLTELTT